MSKQLFDLPDELLLNILSYIINIREKIRLASVNSKFYNLVTEACRTQNYKLINHSDYMYESEYKKIENKDQLINLHELLRVAPRLTHFIDKIYHFGYDDDGDSESNSNGQHLEPLSLAHTKYIYLDLCKSYFFGKPYKTINGKAEMILSNIPSLTTLDIRVDKDCNSLQFPLLNHLKIFKLSYFVTNQFALFAPFPRQTLDRLSNAASNLEEVHFISKRVSVDPDLPAILINLSVNCSNLRAIKLFFQLNDYDNRIRSDFNSFSLDHKLWRLEYLDIRGVYIPIDSWIRLLQLTPNLKFLSFDPSTDPQIKSLIFKLCSKVKYNAENPFEIEEEYRIYCQKTYGFDKDRYL